MSQQDHNNADRAANRKDRRERGKKIGDKLRAMYDDVASEPVPDEFLKLLEDADEVSEHKGNE